MEEFSFTGIWWTPSGGAKIGGELKYTHRDGFVLSLVDTLTDVSEMLELLPTEIILGTSTGGKPITLVNCLRQSGQLRSTGRTLIASEVWVADTAYLGEHFLDIDTLRFSSLVVQFTHLADFAGFEGFTERRFPVPSAHQTRLHGYQLTTGMPQHVEAEIPDTKLIIENGFESVSNGLTSVSVHHHVQLRVVIDKPIPMNQWFKLYIKPLQNLVSLATGVPNALQKIVVSAQNSKNDEDETTEAEVFVQPYFVESAPYQPLKQRELLIRLQDILERFESVMQAWFVCAKELETVYDYFFSVQYAPSMYTDHRFLNMVFAAETYGRFRRPNKLFSDEELKERVQTICSVAPKQYRGWLKWRLAHGNEPSLKDRIIDLATNSVVANDIVGPEPTNKHDFAEKVADTRNYMAHNNPQLRARAASEVELHFLTQTLSLLLIDYFLGELGLDASERLAMIKRGRLYREMAQNQQHRSW